jgi:Xaa-Pro aminopeptidase
MNNIGRIMAALSAESCGAILITSPVNRLFATGFTSSAGTLLVSESGAWFFTDSRYYEAASAAISHAQVRLVTREEPYAERINAVIAQEGIKTLGFESGALTYREHLDWQEKLSAELSPLQGLLDGLRAVKSEDDLNGMIKAQRIAEKSFEDILPLIGSGITEKELAAELICRFFKNGADDKSFDPIIVSGERTSLPHGVAGDRPVGKGFLTLDFGVKLCGWCSDTTRTVCVGPPTDEMIKVYDTVLNAQETGIRAARQGVLGSDLDAIARAVIEKAGFGAYFGHGFGHGLGLEVHETPNASPAYGEKIPAGAVISAEPGIYLPGRFGVRIEDVIHITESGCRNITSLPKTLMVF